MRFILTIILFSCLACKSENKTSESNEELSAGHNISYAKGFSISNFENGVKKITVTSPWPNSDDNFNYALIPREQIELAKSLPFKADAIVPVPVQRVIVTSTTHIPALEVLGVAHTLIGFPETRYISSPGTRKRIDQGNVAELGKNESLNTEITIALDPDLVVGFGIDNQNKAYSTIESTGIPVVYNGDWTEESPLGKAEWIKFFAPFFELQSKADSIFNFIESDYLESVKLAQSAQIQPTVLSGALYKDIWYLPAGDSWAAKFIEDANANYLWKHTEGTGSLSLSMETVLTQADKADIWISPSQFGSYLEMEKANDHYLTFRPFKERKVYTFVHTKGETGGLLYYELAPNRPDIVLRDLIHIFHPQLLPDHQPYFFKPLD